MCTRVRTFLVDAFADIVLLFVFHIFHRQFDLKPASRTVGTYRMMHALGSCTPHTDEGKTCTMQYASMLRFSSSTLTGSVLSYDLSDQYVKGVPTNQVIPRAEFRRRIPRIPPCTERNFTCWRPRRTSIFRGRKHRAHSARRI